MARLRSASRGGEFKSGRQGKKGLICDSHHQIAQLSLNCIAERKLEMGSRWEIGDVKKGWGVEMLCGWNVARAVMLEIPTPR